MVVLYCLCFIDTALALGSIYCFCFIDTALALGSIYCLCFIDTALAMVVLIAFVLLTQR